ncbi:hypothetical protein Q8W71_01905 [Methylobacterium sp. NEAU 140]|uniref:hypothetical protein n=1 Tax=Methylobacterium sp. NEAU 140 TaxID=3064945 RepID=UPI00273648E9|nr:hypothetical protein [Methylobacterium sp. NEAU 140]MDP4021364.1 hypothetical protein [Methylobacterium sp. NEAU 140]
MRLVLAAALGLATLAAARGAETRLDGPVTGGSFGMGGSDYYGYVRSRMPYTGEQAPQPIGVAEIERHRAVRRARAAAEARAVRRGKPRGADAGE